MSVNSRLRTLAIAVCLTVLAVVSSAQAGKSHHAKKNSVVSSSIKNGQVTHKDLAKEAVSAKNLQPDTLTGQEIKELKLDFDVLQKRISGACASGLAVSAIHSDGTVDCVADATGADWSLTGNGGTTPGANFLGTTNNQAFLLKVNSQRALRLEPDATAPNLIGGFSGNTVDAGRSGATIAGGGQAGSTNRVTGDFGAVGGGSANTAGNSASVTGGVQNTASGDGATVAGGFGNTASGLQSAVVGGFSNVASGQYAITAGGQLNKAAGVNSFVAGLFADDQAHDGVFLFSDSSDGQFKATADNSFAARATGGVRFVSGTGPTTGVKLAPGGGSWSSLSDRNAKNHVRAISSRAVLRKVAALPVHTWSYRTQDASIRHMGPMAQAFRKAFGLGEDARHIDDVDAQGVALAAVKGAAKRIDAQQREIQRLRRAVRRLERR